MKKMESRSDKCHHFANPEKISNDNYSSFFLEAKFLKEQLTEHRLTVMLKRLVCKLLEYGGAMILLVFGFGSGNCTANGDGHMFQCPGVHTSKARLHLNCFKLPLSPKYVAEFSMREASVKLLLDE